MATDVVIVANKQNESPKSWEHDKVKEWLEPIENNAKNSTEHKDENRPPFEKCLLDYMEISVTEPEKRFNNTSMKLQEAYFVYLVETKLTDTSFQGALERGPFSLWRRYSEFELLRNYLETTYPTVVVPPLPEKWVSFAWQKVSTDKFDPDFIERRRVGLESFLLRVASHPVLSMNEVFMGFLQQEENWKESLSSSGYLARADAKLKSLNATYRLKKPNSHFDAQKNYSNELYNNIRNLLKMRAKLANRVYGIHKVHADYGRVFSEWSGIENEMGDGLQGAGHFMDVYAALIDSLLEEEEQFADQLKEYLFFAEALKSVCRRQELVQYNLEKAEENVILKKSQKEQLINGNQGFSFSGMKSRLFGSDISTNKELKIQAYEDQIKEAEENLNQCTQEANEFVEKALQELERFKAQEVKDLKEIFITFAILQIKMYKKSISIWSNIRDCFVKM